jgi:predicted transcriptional regulator/pimeloyl-ACP methyl ester carboxylesterase
LRVVILGDVDTATYNQRTMADRLLTLQERFIVACYEESGGHFDWALVAEKVGLRKEAAKELIDYYLDGQGLIRKVGLDTMAIFTEKGQKFVETLIAKRDAERAATEYVAKQLEQAAIEKCRKLVDELSDQERYYLLALEHLGDNLSLKTPWRDIRQFVPDPERTVLKSLQRKGLLTDIQPGRPFFWKLTPEGMKLVPFLKEWLAQKREQSGGQEQMGEFLRKLELSSSQEELILALIERSKPHGTARVVDRRRFPGPVCWEEDQTQSVLLMLSELPQLPNGHRLVWFNRTEIYLDPEAVALGKMIEERRSATAKDDFRIDKTKPTDPPEKASMVEPPKSQPPKSEPPLDEHGEDPTYAGGHPEVRLPTRKQTERRATEDQDKFERLPHVVITLHGIRTHGTWQKRLAADLSANQLITEPLDYGKYLTFQMVRASSRRRKVGWFLAEYTQIRERYPDAQISVIAHSFGTYMVASAMEIYPQVKFNRVIFCGGIVEPGYPWDKLIANGQAEEALNEYGGRDFWAGIVANVVEDAGPSGRTGFAMSHPNVQQRHYPGFRHSDYFHPLHYQETWIPFLKGKPIGPGAIEHAHAVNTRFRRNRRVVIGLSALILGCAAIQAISNWPFSLRHRSSTRPVDGNQLDTLNSANKSMKTLPEIDGTLKARVNRMLGNEFKRVDFDTVAVSPRGGFFLVADDAIRLVEDTDGDGRVDKITRWYDLKQDTDLNEHPPERLQALLENGSLVVKAMRSRHGDVKFREDGSKGNGTIESRDSAAK